MPGIPPDFVRSSAEFSSIPELWHLPKDPWEGIWQRVTGKTIRIAVLDTGIVSHPNLPTPIAAKSFIQGEDVSDRNGHSTHCSGTALGRDGLGVAPEAELIIGKVLSNSGSGGSGGIAAGIRWATEQGADIISMSLGGGSSYGPTNDAIDAAWAKGIIVNCAAGNAGYAGGRNTIGWPAKYRGALCNAAYQRNGTIAGFSSGGEEVDWATPGQNIISASNRGGGYAELSGTSMATPFGSGLLALIVQMMRQSGEPAWTAADAVRKFFQQWCEDVGDAGKDNRFGFGVPKYEAIVEALSKDDIKWL